MRIMGYDSHRYCQIAMLDTDTGELARLPEIEKLSLECTEIKKGGLFASPLIYGRICESKIELRSDLNQTWALTGGWVIGNGLSKIRGLHVVDNAACPEVFVIEDVVEFNPQLQSCRFGDVGVFKQLEIPIVDSWPVEEAPVRIALHPDLAQREQ